MSISPGMLITLNVDKGVSPEHWVLAPSEGDFIRLYEKIDLKSFPGWNDFTGYSKLFKNEILLVVKKKGRPLDLNTKDVWNIYDVYSVVYENKVYECFLYCMNEISGERS